MHSILIDFGPIALHSYGLAMALAFGFGIWVSLKRADHKGVSRQLVLDLVVLILIFSLVGARFTYVVTHWSEFRDHPIDAISPIQHSGRIGIAGLVLLGGVAAAFLTVYVFAKRKKLPFRQLTDLLIPATALGIAIGRIGCFLNGCCFGLPTHLPWCVTFPVDSLAGHVFPETCLHPTQLYEAAYMAIVFVVLLRFDRRPRLVGRVTGLFLLLYGVGRLFNESLRWYEPEMVLLQTEAWRFTFSQLLCVLMAGCGLVLLLWKKGRTPR